MKNCVCFCVILSIQFLGSLCSPRTVYLDRLCGSVITISKEPRGVLRLGLTPDDEYAPFTDCHVTVVANQNAQIGVSFLDMNVMSESCQSDYLQVYDGVKITNSTFLFTSTHNYKQFCGRRLPPYLASRHSNVTFRFVSDAAFSSKGFLLLLTAFHTGKCQDDEFKCRNSRCINEDLYCDDYNNCGDGSDICQFSLYIIVGVALSSFILVFALIFLCSVLHYRFKKRHSSVEDELDYDSVSIGTEYTDIEHVLPGSARTTNASSWFPGFNTNIISIITRSSMDADHSSNRESAEDYSTARSYWLNNQLAF